MSADSNDIVGLGAYSGPAERLCEIADCDARVYCRKLCKRHYVRAWRHGNPLTVIASEDRKIIKLSEAKVLEIRQAREKGILLKSLAEQYDVDTSTISAAATGKNWRWVS